MVFLPNYSGPICLLVVLWTNTLYDRKLGRTFPPVMTHFAKKTCVINSLQIVLKDDLVLNLFEPLTQNFNRVYLIKHFLPVNRVDCRPHFTHYRKRPSFSCKELIMPQKLILCLKYKQILLLINKWCINCCHKKL